MGGGTVRRRRSGFDRRTTVPGNGQVVDVYTISRDRYVNRDAAPDPITPGRVAT
jgi:hypothetical protein